MQDVPSEKIRATLAICLKESLCVRAQQTGMCASSA